MRTRTKYARGRVSARTAGRSVVALVGALLLAGIGLRPADANTAGANYAGSASSAAWTNASNAVGAEDNVCASGSSSSAIDVTGFGFTVPIGATVKGITVQPKFSRTANDNGAKATARLIKAGSTLGDPSSTLLAGNIQNDCSKSAFATLGGAADLWGTTGLRPKDVDDPTFGVRITAGSSTAAAGLLDAVKITIDYDPDTTAPVVVLDGPPDGTVTKDATPILSGTGGTAPGDSANVTVTIKDAGDNVVQTLTPSRDGTTGAYSVAAALLADGAYTAQASQSDDSGNVGTSSVLHFTVDTTPPQISLDSPADGDVTNDDTPTFSGTAGTAPGDSSDVSVEIRDSEDALVETLTTTRDADTGAFSVDADPALDDGMYTATPTQSDNAGNDSETVPVTFTVDTVGPSTTVDQASPPVVVGGNITGTSSDATSCATSTTVTFRNLLTNETEERAAEFTSSCGPSRTWTVPTSGLVGGFEVTAASTDAGGNEGSPSAPVTVAIASP